MKSKRFAAFIVVSLILLVPLFGSCSANKPYDANAELPKVSEVDLSQLKASDFSDDELDIPYLLKHFSTIANSMITEDETFLFIHLRPQKETNLYPLRTTEYM